MDLRQKEEMAGNLLEQERLDEIQDSLNIALATLSHYINNATMNISGQCEVLQLLYQSGDKDRLFEKIPPAIELIKSSIRKISTTMEELSDPGSLANNSCLKNKKAAHLEAELNNRLESSGVRT